MTTKAGTLFFMAPEVLSLNYTSKCDVWSAGVILFVMLSGYPPFASEDEAETIELIKEGEVEFDEDAWGEISTEAKDLLLNLLTNEKDRLSVKKVLSHPWIKKYADGEVKGKILDCHVKKLKEYQNKSRLRKAIMTYLSTRVGDEDVIEEKKIFDMLDSNKDGYITIKELKAATKESHFDVDIQKILLSIDMDKNGAINYTEFIAASMNEVITKDYNKIKAAFKFFDTNNDGIIDHKDLQKIMESNDDMTIDEKVLKEVIKECDVNNDGQIDYAEFYKCMSLRLPK